jgi:hypothetical protein
MGPIAQAWVQLSHENGVVTMIPVLTPHGPTLTSAGFASTSEVRTSAILE